MARNCACWYYQEEKGGAVAQSGERNTGSVEVRGSNPLSSTNPQNPVRQRTPERPGSPRPSAFPPGRMGRCSPCGLPDNCPRPRFAVAPPPDPSDNEAAAAPAANCQSGCNKKRPDICRASPVVVVARRGFEPLISTLKGWRPGPLDERAAVRLVSGYHAGRFRAPVLAPGLPASGVEGAPLCYRPWLKSANVKNSFSAVRRPLTSRTPTTISAMPLTISMIGPYR